MSRFHGHPISACYQRPFLAHQRTRSAGRRRCRLLSKPGQRRLIFRQQGRLRPEAQVGVQQQTRGARGSGQQRDRHLQVVLDAADQRPELLQQRGCLGGQAPHLQRHTAKPILGLPHCSGIPQRLEARDRGAILIHQGFQLAAALGEPGCDALRRGLLPGGLQARAADPHARLAQAARQRPRRSNRRAGHGMTLPGDMFGELTQRIFSQHSLPQPQP